MGGGGGSRLDKYTQQRSHGLDGRRGRQAGALAYRQGRRREPSRWLLRDGGRRRGRGGAGGFIRLCELAGKRIVSRPRKRFQAKRDLDLGPSASDDQRNRAPLSNDRVSRASPTTLPAQHSGAYQTREVQHFPRAAILATLSLRTDACTAHAASPSTRSRHSRLTNRRRAGQLPGSSCEASPNLDTIVQAAAWPIRRGQHLRLQ